MDLHSKMTMYVTSTMTSPILRQQKRLNDLGFTLNIKSYFDGKKNQKNLIKEILCNLIATIFKKKCP
jgi:hypothetical protein